MIRPEKMFQDFLRWQNVLRRLYPSPPLFLPSRCAGNCALSQDVVKPGGSLSLASIILVLDYPTLSRVPFLRFGLYTSIYIFASYISCNYYSRREYCGVPGRTSRRGWLRKIEKSQYLRARTLCELACFRLRVGGNFSLSSPLAANGIEIFGKSKTQENNRRVIILIRGNLKIIDALANDQTILLYSSILYLIWILKFSHRYTFFLNMCLFEAQSLAYT